MCYSCAGADGLGLQLAVVRLCEWIFSLLIAESFQFRRAIYPGSAEDTADIKRQQESIKNEMDLSVGRIDARGNVSYYPVPWPWRTSVRRWRWRLWAETCVIN